MPKKITIFQDMNKNQSDGIDLIAKKIGLEPTQNKHLKNVLELKDHLQQVKAESKDVMLNAIVDYWTEIGDEIVRLIRGVEKQKKRGNKNGKRKD
jgi:hypothetical protein